MGSPLEGEFFESLNNRSLIAAGASLLGSQGFTIYFSWLIASGVVEHNQCLGLG